jgi:hypothetical protein
MKPRCFIDKICDRLLGQPTKFELAINLKIAKAIGTTEAAAGADSERSSRAS